MHSGETSHPCLPAISGMRAIITVFGFDDNRQLRQFRSAVGRGRNWVSSKLFQIFCKSNIKTRQLRIRLFCNKRGISVGDVDLLWRSSMVSRLSFCCWSDRSLKSDSMRLSTVMSGWKAVTVFRQLGQLSSPPGARLCHLSMQYWQNL